MGSFLACQAWRLRYKELGKKGLGKWSVCLSCGHRLAWFENIPIFSWLFLRGKCRKCGKKIGALEIIAELLMGLSFLGISSLVDFGFSAIQWVDFIVMLLFIMSIGFLAIYDGMWGELPTFMLVVTNVIAVALFALNGVMNGFSEHLFINTGIAIMILFGVYWILSKLSKGEWVGDGDSWLGLALAFAIGDWWLALWIMFLSNALGSVVGLGERIKNAKKKIFFGPFLAIAFIIVYTFKIFIGGLL